MCESGSAPKEHRGQGSGFDVWQSRKACIESRQVPATSKAKSLAGISKVRGHGKKNGYEHDNKRVSFKDGASRRQVWCW